VGRFVGFRIEGQPIRDKDWSYHYYPLINDDELGRRIDTTVFLRKLLELPNAKQSDLRDFYDPVWEGTIDKDSEAVKSLRRKLKG
jgi:hypothetical protein